MEIQEDNANEIKTNSKDMSNLTLRKKKDVQKSSKNENNNIFKETKPFNELLPGEIELENDDLVFSNKKRQRDGKASIINVINNDSLNINYDIKTVNDEEKILSEKALEIYKQLQIPPTPGLKEGDYDSIFHDKREKIVLDILKDENMVINQRKLACTTKNVDIFCAILDNFNAFCYYNNKFMVNSHDYLDKIVDNAFEFEDKSKSIPLALKFCNTVFEFGFFEEHQRYINFFINLIINDTKMKYLSNIPRAKIYLYYIIYLVFKDSSDNIELDNGILKNFMGHLLLDINIYDHELTQIIIQLINTICDNILYHKIFKNESIDISIAAEINKYMFKLISEIIKNLGPEEKDKIIKDENINYIIKQSFNIIIKIVSGINLVNENINTHETLVIKENKVYYYEFIKFFSSFSLDNKNFCWFLDIMAKFAEVSYYSDIYLKEDIIHIIFDKFIAKKNMICEIFQFMRSLLETEPLFKFFSSYEKFYVTMNSLDEEKSPYLANVHYLFMVKQLLEKGEALGCLDKIYDRLCCIQAKEKVEQIFYKHGNEKIIHEKYNEIMPKLDELNKKIQID
jgi:hypothetical protein